MFSTGLARIINDITTTENVIILTLKEKSERVSTQTHLKLKSLTLKEKSERFSTQTHLKLKSVTLNKSTHEEIKKTHGSKKWSTIDEFIKYFRNNALYDNFMLEY